MSQPTNPSIEAVRLSIKHHYDLDVEHVEIDYNLIWTRGMTVEQLYNRKDLLNALMDTVAVEDDYGDVLIAEIRKVGPQYEIRYWEPRRTWWEAVSPDFGLTVSSPLY